jgi:hypothetical protein
MRAAGQMGRSWRARIHQDGLLAALKEQRSEKYRQGLIGVVSIGVRAGQLGRTDAWRSSHLVSHA